MQNARVSSVTDKHGYMVEVRIDHDTVFLTGIQGDTTQQVLIDESSLDDVIMVLEAIRNAHNIGLGQRPLWAVIDGEHTGCLCMELVRASDDGVHRDVHIVYVPVSDYHDIKTQLGSTVFLRRDQYMPFAPSHDWEMFKFKPKEEASVPEEPTEESSPILPGYLRD